MIHVAVGILKNLQDEILIAKRPAHQHSPGLWEFPGGKVEANETVFQALQREFYEEIGVQVLTADAWFQCQYEYPNRTVLLDNWIIKDFLGEPYGAEGQEIKWVNPKDLQQYEFPQGSKVLLDKLLMDAAAPR